jgi:hypothetical protein
MDESHANISSLTNLDPQNLLRRLGLPAHGNNDQKYIVYER